MDVKIRSGAEMDYVLIDVAIRYKIWKWFSSGHRCIQVVPSVWPVMTSVIGELVENDSHTILDLFDFVAPHN